METQSKQNSASESLPLAPPNNRRGIYLLPNLLTTCALFAGFYSIIASTGGEFIKASVALLVAQLLDGMDGRVARMTHTQSEFGAQYDSMSDNLAFGVAPAILAYQWSLFGLGKLGWVAAFIFVAGAALRLARFNTQINLIDKKFFVGLSSPAAAGLIWTLVWALTELGVSGSSMTWVMVVLVPLAGALMVSPVRYYSFKDLSDKGRVPFVVLLISVMIIAIIALDPARVLLAIAIIYALSGPLFEGWRWLKTRKHPDSKSSQEFNQDE